MLLALKNEFARIAIEQNGIFTCKSHSELEDFAQSHNFSSSPIINLEPIRSIKNNIQASGAIRYNFQFNLRFLTNFKKSDHLEFTKDIAIDEMIAFSEAFFWSLNKNEALFFINPQWTWTTEVIRQYLSNLTVGLKATIDIDTACNRVPTNNQFEYLLEMPMN